MSVLGWFGDVLSELARSYTFFPGRGAGRDRRYQCVIETMSGGGGSSIR